ncbi:MAG: ECF transporter S component [Oscillospiraceae bacterium]|nr:ECF transporter S component [Oscillospiraceae bacterium]
MKSRKLVTCAMLIALHTVLGQFVSINLGNMKITFDALPIIVGAMLYGPVDGMLIGLL